MAKKEYIPQTSQTYRYQLEKYRYGCKVTCPSCGRKKSFKRYVDVTTGDYVGADVGACDRLKKCGYHKSPKELKEAYVPTTQVVQKYREPEVYNRIPTQVVLKTLSFGRDNFSKALIERFPNKDVVKVLNLYYIGLSDKWQGATVFWQIDSDFTVRTGKVMLYEGLSRVKEPYSKVAWAHTPCEGYPDYNLRQCLFGQHLVGDKPVGVVESEKTALICSLFKPERTWVATGGLQNISSHRFEFLGDREDVVFFPDKGCELDWEKKVHWISNKWEVSRFLLTNPQVSEGQDLADFILKLK